MRTGLAPLAVGMMTLLTAAGCPEALPDGDDGPFGVDVTTPDVVADALTGTDTVQQADADATEADAASDMDTTPEPDGVAHADVTQDAVGPGDASGDEVSLPALQCLPLEDVTCGAVVSANTGGPGGRAKLGWYPCAPPEAETYAASKEVAWRLTVAAPARVTVSESPVSPSHVLVLEDVGQGCVPTEDGCLAGGVDEAVFDAVPGVEYYIVADAPAPFYTATDVTLEIGCCVPDCQDLLCGDDGCGGSCGECAAGSECQEGQCVAAP